MIYIFSALEAMVNFAYTGQVTIDRYNAQSLLIAANFLHLTGIRDACCDFFKERLGMNYFFELLFSLGIKTNIRS